ncbi:hypothetical protein [Nocardioides sp.]|uniref:hypothetical protein n=1 Tax=Nocardioides sp. TaxID=35761 RepID=UPI00351430B9
MSGGTPAEAFAWEDGGWSRRLVTRCALARVCGACGTPLGRPIAFLGDAEETARNAFHAPPMHRACAEGLQGPVGATHLVLTAGFEFVRPGADDPDTRVRCAPNSLL